MEKVNIKVNRHDIFNYVVGNSVFDPIEKCIDPTQYEVLDAFIYDSKNKTQKMQSAEYQRFCWEVGKLKQFSENMKKPEIERVCEELEEIAPTYVLL
jgi:hypothetical protein|tara:strand:+ start:5961 stop:6251 length:291 start_codon:yes stop_codon:yes gene_type:complete